MSTGKARKSQLMLAPGHTGASTTSRKSQGASVMKSKYGKVGGTTYNSSRTNIPLSASKTRTEKQTEKPQRAPVQVYDEAGNDVTPLPLFVTDPNQVSKKQSNLLGESSAGTPTDLMSQASIYNTGTVTASTFGGPFTRSVFTQSYDTGSESMIEPEETDHSQDLPSWGEKGDMHLLEGPIYQNNYELLFYSDKQLSEEMSENKQYSEGTSENGDMEIQVVTQENEMAATQHIREDVKEILTELDLEKVVDLTLTETETIWLLDMPGVCCSTESEEAAAIKQNNERYQELVKNKQGNDRYAERGMNTFNEPQKCKLVQTAKIGYAETGVNASTWDMYDTFEQLDKETKAKTADDDEEGTISRPSSPKEGETEDEKVIKDSVQSLARESSSATVRIDSRATFTSSFAGSESVFASKETGVSSIPSELAAVDEDKVLNSENFKTDLFVMERVINLNTYQPKQALYRDFPIIKEHVPPRTQEKKRRRRKRTESGDKPRPPDIDSETSAAPQQLAVSDGMGPNFDRLWAYTCKMTQGHNVSCLSWNKVNPDLIAVGYGQFEFSNQREGLVLCWSLKNPEYPERVYTCKEGVTAADFSRHNPSLLAVGLYDGGVAVYNVKHTADEPIIDNFLSLGKHTAPVWQIKWIEKERGSGEETAEVLVSISTDGRVTQWSIRKGFESYDLMRLKKMPTRMGGKKEKKGEAFISRHAGGLCFDFHTRDTNIYLAGTEDGHIHRCSCSYNEQFLESYSGHTGPVYKIAWSPFVSDIFLSCSADWSLRLWHQDRPRPVLNFFSSTKPVFDIAWSPRSSTVFACVNEGAVEVWDLNVSTLDPIIINNPTSGAKQTSVTFARNSECLLVGDSEGQVTVLQLRSMPTPPAPEKQSDVLMKIINTSLASQLQHQTPSEVKLEEADDQLKDDLEEV